MKDKYDKLIELRKQYDFLKGQVAIKKDDIRKLEDELEKLERRRKGTYRNKNQLINDLENAVRDLNSKLKHLENYQDDLQSTTQQLVEYIHELSEIKNLIPYIYSDVSAELKTDKLPSVGQLKLQREDGQVTFNNARNETGIDPAAPENYQAVKQEYERLDDEYKRTTILLEQDKERADDLKDKLETTINMRVTEFSNALNRI
jgi:chromosome segregation ATPase